MGYITTVFVNYQGLTFITEAREPYDDYVYDHIKYICKEYSIYKNYITKNNILFFLNKYNTEDNNEEWPFFSSYKYIKDDPSCCISSDNVISVCIEETVITYQVDRIRSEEHKYALEKQPITPVFENFLNYKFMLDKLFKKFNVPGCLGKWIKTNYF